MSTLFGPYYGSYYLENIFAANTINLLDLCDNHPPIIGFEELVEVDIEHSGLLGKYLSIYLTYVPIDP